MWDEEEGELTFSKRDRLAWGGGERKKQGKEAMGERRKGGVLQKNRELRAVKCSVWGVRPREQIKATEGHGVVCGYKRGVRSQKKKKRSSEAGDAGKPDGIP